jgi:hypothetical protein
VFSASPVRPVLDAAAAADGPEHDQAGLDADANHQRVLGCSQVGDDAQAGADGALSVVLVRDRCAEQREDPVAGQVLDGPAERLDGLDHAPNGAAQDLARVLGVEAFGEVRRADDVGNRAVTTLRSSRIGPRMARSCCPKRAVGTSLSGAGTRAAP